MQAGPASRAARRQLLGVPSPARAPLRNVLHSCCRRGASRPTGSDARLARMRATSASPILSSRGSARLCTTSTSNSGWPCNDPAAGNVAGRVGGSPGVQVRVRGGSGKARWPGGLRLARTGRQRQGKLAAVPRECTEHRARLAAELLAATAARRGEVQRAAQQPSGSSCGRYRLSCVATTAPPRAPAGPTQPPPDACLDAQHVGTHCKHLHRTALRRRQHRSPLGRL